MRRLLTVLGLLSFCAGLAGQESGGGGNGSGVGEYIRYLEEEDADDRLQTAVSRFTRGRTAVDLVAVVHLADAAYFDKLNDFLARYDVVLYEMIGGARSGARSGQEPGEGGAGDMGGVRRLQGMAASLLGLEFQLDGIDYGGANFVHADADWERYHSLMEARNQSFGTLFERAMRLGEDGELDLGGVPTDEASMKKLFGRVVTALASGDSDGLKRVAAPLVSEAEGFITQIEGEDGTVLVTERNKIVMEKLREVMRSRGDGSYAVFYGAGHMPDLEERLLGEGFRPDETAWVDAWEIPGDPGDAATGGASGTSVDMLLDVLEGNPEVMDAIRRIGESLEALQGAR